MQPLSVSSVFFGSVFKCLLECLGTGALSLVCASPVIRVVTCSAALTCSPGTVLVESWYKFRISSITVFLPFLLFCRSFRPDSMTERSRSFTVALQ
uniref:Putative secreted protein n=1 Tax=Ixodes ricinus TaxID=34613 RepID=A0A6B0U6K7_IXORI